MQPAASIQEFAYVYKQCDNCGTSLIGPRLKLRLNNDSPEYRIKFPYSWKGNASSKELIISDPDGNDWLFLNTSRREFGVTFSSDTYPKIVEKVHTCAMESHLNTFKERSNERRYFNLVNAASNAVQVSLNRTPPLLTILENSSVQDKFWANKRPLYKTGDLPFNPNSAKKAKRLNNPHVRRQLQF